MSKYRSFCNFNPYSLFFKQHKSCLLKDMINHHHLSIESIILSFLNTGTQKKYGTVLNAHLQAAATFRESSINLNNLMEALQI